ncbi:hypothetical protein RSAG8_10894, partial [Rhizoctonia solani AG-8 WAC10335]
MLRRRGISSHPGSRPRFNLGDLVDGIDAMSHALALNSESPDDPDLPDQLSCLVITHINQFGPLTQRSNLEIVMEFTSQAIALTPDAHPRRPKWLSTLATSHGDRFQRLGEIGDLEKAIDYMTRALAVTLDDDLGQPKRLSDLGEFHGHRFRRLGHVEDLEKAINLTQDAVSLTPADDPALPHRFNNLGVFYGDRFHHRGDLADGDKAIHYGLKAVALTPDGHPDMSKWLSSLGTSYGDRFRRLGEIGDLEVEIKYIEHALELTADDHPDLPHRLSNLGTSYRDRFQRLGDIADSSYAIQYSERAVLLAPADHPDLPKWLGSLGGSYGDRFRRLGDLGDLQQEGLTRISQAVALTPAGHPDLTKWLYGLAESHSDRFLLQESLFDLSQAIQHAVQALSLTPKGHPSLPAKNALMARLRFLEYETTDSVLFLDDTLKYFRIASKSSAGAPGTKFKIALQWAELASGNDRLQCMEAYQTAVDLLEQLPHIWLGATANQRYEDLWTAENLATDASAAAILSSRYELALEWLEHARCVVWYQSLVLRSPLDELRSVYPALAVELENVAQQLNIAGSGSREEQVFPAAGSLTPEQIGQMHRRLAMRYDELLGLARELSGFEDFLRPRKASELVRAARSGPIVVINCSSDRCDALIVLPGQEDIVHVPLPNFSKDKARHAYSKIQGSLRIKRMRTRGVRVFRNPDYNDTFGSILAIIWAAVVKPVLDVLGYTDNVSTDNLPHITWCPTGLATFLPLHAAGDYSSPRSRVFDFVISSYTPILTPLLMSKPSTLSLDSRVLGVGLPNAPGHAPLPEVIKELSFLQMHMEGRAKYSQLVNEQATMSAVLDEMQQHDWVHLACHAAQNVVNPTKSGFSLYDRPMDLTSINRRTFTGKGLAFLSACQTAAGDEVLPDEAIHLASAMLMAGYPSIIATMWSILDKDAPLVADKVYGQLMGERTVGNGEAAAKALHYAVAALRENIGENEFARWASFIHIGS